jgi:hypothetical protein
MVALVRRTNQLLSGTSLSLYNMSFINPFNAIPTRWLSRRFGISDRFWRSDPAAQTHTKKEEKIKKGKTHKKGKKGRENKIKVEYQLKRAKFEEEISYFCSCFCSCSCC